MTPEQYRQRVWASLDATRTPEKDRIISGFIEQLFPNGDPDHAVNGAAFIAEAIRLLAAFHPSNLAFPEEKADSPDDAPELEF